MDEDAKPANSQDVSTADLPWYLQVEPPRHVASVEPPPLPEVPPGSPAVIGSLLEYSSEELGLDDISLLDLRELDPPPALGPGLFMLFGTARSERHLHISAGRLLRWLRYEYRISANADGLLGPNERKRKLRRKAKRAKLLGIMGTDDTDDGIRTGWICVNLGSLGRGKGESTIVGEDGRVAGFGMEQSGATIVFQIMTESRRAELDLETLWGKALNPTNAEDQLSLQTNKNGPKERPSSLHLLEHAVRSNSPARPTGRNGRGKASSFGQASFYSTAASIKRRAEPLRNASIDDLSHILTYDVEQKIRVLELLRAHLNELAPSDIHSTLGFTKYERVATPFLRLFEVACGHLPVSMTWAYRLAIQAKALEAGKGAIIDLDDVRGLLQEMRVSPIEASREQYLQLLSCICSVDSSSRSEPSELAVELLRCMYQRGQNIMANDVIVAIIEGKLHHREHSDVATIEALLRLPVEAGLPCMDEPMLMRLMTAYAKHGYWKLIWDTWHTPPRYLRRRSAAMYRLMFRLAADAKSTPVTAIVARHCFQHMLAEDPPIPLTHAMRGVLMECIRIADPHAERIAETLPGDAQGYRGTLARREFVKLVKMIKGIS